MSEIKIKSFENFENIDFGYNDVLKQVASKIEAHLAETFDSLHPTEVNLRTVHPNEIVVMVKSSEFRVKFDIILRDTNPYVAIYHIWVANEGTGVGRTIMSKVETLCKQAGCTQSKIVHALKSSRPFYERLGYVVTDLYGKSLSKQL
ncbi:GNAT family N-acetyltransferase [Candidatus Woesebacteria bacterium]|nr:GNAT family N-acetyltransferase [Candidatus Woesebacteria bacterium]